MKPGKHQDLVTIRYLKESNMKLIGGAKGSVSLVDNRKVIKGWKFGNLSIHWFEHFKKNIYYLASDTRKVIKLDLDNQDNIVESDLIARDDVEHVTYVSSSNRLFASSFDRNVYEICLDSCKVKRIIYTAPYLLRWIKGLNNHAGEMLIQCRDGSLLKINIETGEIIQKIRKMPDAIWTAVAFKNEIFLSGEGENIIKLSAYKNNTYDRTKKFSTDYLNILSSENSYVKRMALHGHDSLAVLGYANGKTYLYNIAKKTLQLISESNSAIKDLDFNEHANAVIVVTESGEVASINYHTKEKTLIFQSDEPVWSLSVNKETQMLETADRNGKLRFFNLYDLSLMGESSSFRPKRMKWVDSNTLLITNSSGMDKFEKVDNKWVHKELFIITLGNTIEDFIIDKQQKYIIAITYNRNIWLCDYRTGTKLNSLFNGIDYTKGLLYLNPDHGLSDYPCDFITYGRNGSVALFRVANEQIIPMKELATSYYD